MRSIYIACFTLLFILNIFSQEDNIWYFGEYAGVDFNSGSPVAVTNSALNTTEGSTAISDKNGGLLFYSDGITVWNRNHAVMPNGTGLLGNSSSTQSATIVPDPSDSLRYYLFTTDKQAGSDGLNYSVIDMSLDGGLGDITIKNTNLLIPVSEKAAVVKHANGLHYWFIAHEYNSDAFYAYLVSCNGVEAPVVSNAGTVHTGGGMATNGYAVGGMNVSPDGSKLALALRAVSSFELFDFDNTTGAISYTLTFNSSYNYVYGIEFSPDGSLLYGSMQGGDIYQFDLNAGTNTAIINSATIIGTSVSGSGALKRGPDDKIYYARTGDDYLGVINLPDILGAGCNFVDDGLYLSGKECKLGLPNTISGISYQYSANAIALSYSDTCLGIQTNFTFSDTAGVDSVLWDFGDVLSGVNNQSSVVEPGHTFSAVGAYKVLLTVYYSCLTVKDSVMVNIISGFNIDIGSDTNICEGDSVFLFVNDDGYNYLWNTGDSDTSLWVKSDGWYWLEVSNGNCTGRDSVYVALLDVDLDVFIANAACIGDSIFLYINDSGGDYLWNTTETDTGIYVTSENNYWVTAIIGNCVFVSDTITPTFDSLPIVFLGNDTALCEGEQLYLDVGGTGDSFLWNDGSTGSDNTVIIEGYYWVSVTENNNCTLSDTIKVSYINNLSVALGSDRIACLDDQVLLDAYHVEADNYLWSDFSSNSTLTATESATYSVQLSNICDTVSDTIELSFEDCSCNIYVPSSFTPDQDNLNDDFRVYTTCTRLTSFSLSVYNRWGDKIFESNTFNDSWDGTFNSMECIPETYSYIIRYRLEGEAQPVKEIGTVSLIR